MTFKKIPEIFIHTNRKAFNTWHTTYNMLDLNM